MVEYFMAGNKCPILSLEGLSGTGKTTVGKLLASKLGGRYFHCKENNPLEFARQFFNKTPLLISYFFYLFYFSLSLLRAKRLSKNSVVFMDKSVAWIYSHYKARNLPKLFIKLIPEFLTGGLDLILYFTVSEKTRHRRVKSRIKLKQATPNDIQSLTIGRRTDKYYREFLPHKLVEIETDGKTPEVVASEVIRKLKKLNLV